MRRPGRPRSRSGAANSVGVPPCRDTYASSRDGDVTTGPCRAEPVVAEPLSEGGCAVAALLPGHGPPGTPGQGGPAPRTYGESSPASAPAASAIAAEPAPLSAVSVTRPAAGGATSAAAG